MVWSEVTPMRFAGLSSADDLVVGIGLEPGHKAYFVPVKLGEPIVIVVAPVKDVDGSLLQAKSSGFLDVMGLGIADIDHCWEITVVIKKSMEFDATLILTEKRSWKRGFIVPFWEG